MSDSEALMIFDFSTLKADDLAGDERRVGLSRLSSPAFKRRVGLFLFWRVDPDVAHDGRRAVDDDIKGVTIDHADNGCIFPGVQIAEVRS